MSTPIPRFLLPRGYSFLQSRPIARLNPSNRSSQTTPLCKRASTTSAPPKVIRLEKPAKFNPPSHGKRLKQQIPRHYGPQLTQEQKKEQQTKRYPNMMPPSGSFMHWFLTSRGIHVFISLGILVLLAAFSAYENWKRATVFREQLPDARSLLSHPIKSVFQAIEVWKMDVARTTAETQARRKIEVEDIQKRTTYRIAHGLEDSTKEGMGPWTPKDGMKTGNPPLRPDGAVGRPISDDKTAPMDRAIADWEGNKRPVKKWLGIW